MSVKPTRDTGATSNATKGELRVLYDAQGRVRLVYYDWQPKKKDVELT